MRGLCRPCTPAYLIRELCAPLHPAPNILSFCFLARQKERILDKKEKPRHNRLITTKLNLRLVNSLCNCHSELNSESFHRSNSTSLVVVSLSSDYNIFRELRSLIKTNSAIIYSANILKIIFIMLN